MSLKKQIIRGPLLLTQPNTCSWLHEACSAARKPSWMGSTAHWSAAKRQRCFSAPQIGFVVYNHNTNWILKICGSVIWALLWSEKQCKTLSMVYFSDENIADFQCKGTSVLFAAKPKVNFNYSTLQLLSDPGSVMRSSYSHAFHIWKKKCYL